MEKNHAKIKAEFEKAMLDADQAGIPAISCVRFPGVGVMGAITGDIASMLALITVLLLKAEKQTGVDAYELAIALRKAVRSEKQNGNKPENWSDHNPKWKKAEGLESDKK